MPTLTEEDALRAINIAKANPDNPEVVAKAQQVAASYRRQQESAGLPLFPATERQRLEEAASIRRAFTDRETHGLDPDKLQLLNEDVRDPERKARIFNNRLLAQRYGKSPDEIRALGSQYRDRYALETWGKKVASDQEFFDRQAEDFKFEDSIAERAFRSAFLDETPLEAIAAIESENQGNEVYKARRDKWLEAFGAQSRIVRERIAPYLSNIATVTDGLVSMIDEESAMYSGAERQEVPSYRELAEAIVTIPKDDRDLSLSAIITRGSEATGEDRKTYARKLAENFSRGVEDYFQNIPAIAERGQALLVQDRVASGAKVPAGAADSPEAYLRAITEGVAGGFAYEEAQMLTGAMGREWVDPSPEVRAQAEELAAQMVDVVDLRQQLRYIAENDIDPAKSDSVVLNGFLQAARSIPYTLTAIAPGGFALNSMMMAESSYQQLRAANPDMTPGEAQAISAISGPLQASLEQISGKILTGKLPAFNRFLNQAVATRGSALARFATRLGAATGTEMVQENVQDITPFAMQGAFAALSEDVPNVPWSEVFGEMAENQPELFFAVLPLALIGSGVGTVSDFRDGRTMLERTDMLMASGVSEAEASDIRAAAIAGDYSRAESILRQAHEKGGQDQQAMAENIRQALPTLIEQSQIIKDLVNKAGDLDMIPAIRRTEEGWAIEYNDGTGSTFESYQEADARRWQHASEMQLRLHSDTINVIRQIDRDLEAGREIKYLISMEAPTLREKVEAGRITEEQAEQRVQIAEETQVSADPGQAIQREFDEAQVSAGIAAQSQDDRLATARILGESVNEYRDGIVRTTVRLYQDASPLTIIEEKAEGDAKAMIDRGMRGWMIAAIRDWERISGDSVFRKATDDELINQDLSEAWSSLVQSYFIGRTKKGDQGPVIKKSRDLFAKILKSKLGAPMEAYARFFRSVWRRAAQIEKARRDGTLDPDLERYLARSVGMSEQSMFEREVVQEGAQLAGEIADGSGDRTFSVLPEQDAEYLELAKDPEANREELQRMVDEAARAAGFRRKVWRGDRVPILAFDRGKSRFNITSSIGFSFTTDKETAAVYGEPKQYFIDTRKTWRLDYVKDRMVPEDAFGYDEEVLSEFLGVDHIIDTEDTDAINEWWDDIGANVVRIDNIDDSDLTGKGVYGGDPERKATLYIVRNPNQIKSADPVTYDADGNVIPLSQRFNPARDEISYSVIPGAFDVESEFSRMFSPFYRSPELRGKLGQELQLRVAKLHNDIERAFRAGRTRASIEREARVREGFEYDRLLRDTFGADTQQAQEALPVVDRQAARSEARAIAEEWKRQKLQDQAGLSRETLTTFMRTLDAIHRAMPPEVRARIGGFVALSQLRTPQAMLDEVRKRVQRADDAIEKWLRDEAEERRKKLWKRVQPKREAGKKPKGKAGADIHALFDTLNDALLWSADEAEAHAAALEAEVAKGELSADEEAHKLIEANLVRFFAEWTEIREDTGRRSKTGAVITRVVREPADAARRTAAMDAAEAVFRDGYMREKQRIAAERERRADARQEIRQRIGTLGSRTERREKALKDAGLSGKLKAFNLNLLNFEQVVNYALGEGSKWARWFTESQRQAEYQKIDEIQAVEGSVEDLFTDLAGGRYRGERLFWEMSQPSIETAQGGELSELEAITAIMYWRQEDGKRHMRGKRDEDGKIVSDWSYDQSFIDEIESKLSANAWAVLDYLTDQYSGEWETLNPIFRELNGINLPRHANYSPIKVKPQQEQSNQTLDPTTGTTMSATSRTPGSLRTRAQVVAEPEFVNAIEHFIAHKKQLAHWKAFAKFNIDAQGILGNREVVNSIKAKGGEEAATQVRSWLDYFAQGGVRDAAAHLEGTKLISRSLGRAASMALVGRAGTLLIQSTQLAAAAAKMPLASYIVRFSKLMTGQLGWRAAIDSPYIQRRIKQAPPHVRLAFEGLRARKPNRLKYAVRQLGETISGADALFTAGTYVMIYDYQRSRFISGGMDESTASELARIEAERITDEVAQPTREGARSMAELTAKHPAAKMVWAFSSEARKNLALMSYSAMNRDKVEFARAALYSILLNGLVGAIIRTGWRDLRSDEEDDDEWAASKLALAVSTEWLYGFPVVGDILQGVIYSAANEWRPQGNLFSVAMDTPKAIQDILEGEADSRDIETIISALGLTNETAAAAASVMHIYRDAEGIVKNLLK